MINPKDINISKTPKNMRRGGHQISGLIDMYNYIGCGEGLELGCNTGCSTEIAAQMSRKLYCVDPWLSKSKWMGESIESWFDRRMLYHKNIIKIKAWGYEAVKQFKDESLDFVYIDAKHDFENCYADIIMWEPKVKSGGFICGHDYNPIIHTDVIRAVNLAIGKPDKVFDDSSWVIRKA